MNKFDGLSVLLLTPACSPASDPEMQPPSLHQGLRRITPAALQQHRTGVSSSQPVAVVVIHPNIRSGRLCPGTSWFYTP